MKKITLLFFLIGTSFLIKAQVLNQNANWPNSAWTLTGSYLATSIQSDPTSTANFAFDDDASGIGHEDNIAAESPVIDLTPAFNAGEKWINVSAQYVYRYLANDELVFQYWNADTSSWINWGTNFDALGNYTTNTAYCSGTPSTYTSVVLNIAGFTPTQLSGFKYRISYDDDPAGADWNYGFCFQSPTIVSSTPPLCPNPTSLAAVVTNNSALLSWTENGSATLYNVEYGANGFTQGTGTLLSGVSNSYNLTSLTPNTAYSYYVQANCGGTAGTSAWIGPFNFTTLFSPPTNDNCSGAIALTVNPDYACGIVTSGTTQGATQSMAATPCFGNPDDDVWFSFVATATSHKIVLSNVVAVGGTGTSVDAYMQVLSGSCGTQTSVLCSDPNTATPTGLTIGQTYYVRVYTYGATNNITFDICIGTPPPPPANDECTGAIPLTTGSAFATYPINTTNDGATLSSTASAPSCGSFNFATVGKDVWYSVTVPASGSITIETATSGTTLDTVVAAYTGSCSSLVQVGCDDDGGTSPYSKVVLTAQTPGTVILVRVFGYNGTSGTFKISAYDASLANSSFESSDFTFYPNPVKDILNLSYNQEISSVEIFNLLGQKISTNKINANDAQIDMSRLTNGAYIVKITSDNQVKTIKVIKQ